MVVRHEDPLRTPDDHLEDWVVEALSERRGSATIIEVCKSVWDRHEGDLRSFGDVFYTWQYDIRWAAHRLRRREVLRSASLSPSGMWELAFRPDMEGKP